VTPTPAVSAAVPSRSSTGASTVIAPGPLPSTATPFVRFEKVNKWYGDFHALRDVDLDVARAERIVVCGPSGSGKSTLIRCVNGLEPYQQGRVTFDGALVGDDLRVLESVRRRVGFVFQHFNLFPHLTVLDNLTLAPTSVLRVPRKEAREFALEQLHRVRIGEQAAKYPSELSGGQQQRVAIARALCMKPDILLFDEPTSALDPEMVKEVLDVMVDLAARGSTMICVTHEMGFARRVADRVVFMDNGQVLEIAPPDQFFSDPRHPRTRDFLSKLLV
jgi:general L-amino acid transport system ATP-binding protein